MKKQSTPMQRLEKEYYKIKLKKNPFYIFKMLRWKLIALKKEYIRKKTGPSWLK
jgi:hypothetical protein